MINKLYKILEKPAFVKHGYLFQIILLTIIMLNIFSTFVPEVINISKQYLLYYTIIEKVTILFFILELTLRYIAIGEDERYRGVLGKIKYTFTFYTIIDIIVIFSFFLNMPSSYIRLVRFFRIIKVLRTVKILKKFISLSAFANTNIFIQAIILFTLSIFFIYLFSYAYIDVNTSVAIFLDPPSLVEASTLREKFFGIAELLIGLIIAGTLISIITEALNTISQKIKDGYQPYKNKNHIIIINENKKLNFILQEIKKYNKHIHNAVDVVIFLPNNNDIEYFRENLPKVKNVDITLIAGEMFNWNSYARANINFAKKIIVLKNEDKGYNNQKLIRYIVSHKEFTNKNLEFIIETDEEYYSPTIYNQIFFNKQNRYLLINYSKIIENFLNRIIVNPEYFKIFTNLLTFDKYIIDIIQSHLFTDNEHTFKQYNLNMNNGVLIGCIIDENISLNPEESVYIKPHDKLIVLREINTMPNLNNEIITTTINNSINLEKPKVKMDKKICIVGDYSNMDINNITEFLSNESINNITKIIAKDNEYRKADIWDIIISEEYDTIILNLEDDYEFLLTLYLQEKYHQNQNLLESLVNIMHDPINALLLDTNNIILSQRLIGRYIAQVLFNNQLDKIFSELTSSNGNELYIIDKQDMPEYFGLMHEDTKKMLLDNDMVYIGIFDNNEFKLNEKNQGNATKMVVLAEGLLL